MPKEKTLEEAYESCKADGFFKDQEIIDKDKIQTMIQHSFTVLEVAQDIKKGLDKKSRKWSVVYSLYYDALRELATVLVQCDKKKIANHQCLFSHLCTHHPELDWNFFEKIRTKRNGIQYYGTDATYNDWREIEVQVSLYIKTLREAVEKRIREFE